MQSRAAWEFAHRYCGARLYKWGLMLLPLSVLGMLVVWGKGEEPVGMVGTVLCLVQILPILIATVQTEQALKEHFDERGRRY